MSAKENLSGSENFKTILLQWNFSEILNTHAKKIINFTDVANNSNIALLCASLSSENYSENKKVAIDNILPNLLKEHENTNQSISKNENFTNSTNDETTDFTGKIQIHFYFFTTKSENKFFPNTHTLKCL